MAADAKDQLTLSDCHKILAKSLKGIPYEVTSYTMDSLSDTKNGFLGDHFILSIQYESGRGPGRRSFFMKILNGKFRIIFELALSIRAYDKEEFVYSFLLADYIKYKVDADFAPAGYLCKPYSIVLEDLSDAGYCGVRTQRDHFLDVNHCRVALGLLARFHTSSILYEEARSKDKGAPFRLDEEYSQILDDKMFTEEENGATKWFQFSLQGLHQLAELIPENHITKEQFKSKLEEAQKKFIDSKALPSNSRNCLLHGDLWLKNFLFLYQDDIPINAKLVDYQIINYGPPHLDVMHTIVFNTRRNLRDQHHKQLLEYYHDCFREIISKHGLDCEQILPRDDFLRICTDTQFRISCLLSSLCDRGTTFLPDHITSEAYQSDETVEKFMFEDRPKYITRSFNEDTLFREVMTEDMIELRELLFQNN